jgi:hypothetical protein
MQIQQIVDVVRRLKGSLVVEPRADGPFPEIAWGDAFFYYAPDGVMPERTQPYATIVTKNYPDDELSRLDEPGRFRVNIHVGPEAARGLVTSTDPAQPDAFLAHPVYGTAGWVSVVNPATSTSDDVVRLLRDAHDAARSRAERRERRG